MLCIFVVLRSLRKLGQVAVSSSIDRPLDAAIRMVDVLFAFAALRALQKLG